MRLADDQLARIDRLVGELHASRSDAIRRAIDLYIYRLACEHDARAYELDPLSDAEHAFADARVSRSFTPAW